MVQLMLIDRRIIQSLTALVQYTRYMAKWLLIVFPAV